MGIQNIIMHEVRKDEGDAETTVILREEENEINEHANKLSQELSALFKKTGLNTGHFSEAESEDDPSPHFLNLLKIYFKQNEFEDFVKFSQAAAKELKRQLDKSTLSKGGYLWLNHYKHSEENFLSVVLLRKESRISISDDLSLDQVEQIDLSKLHMAARVNLSAWLNGQSSRYISFRIGRGARDVTNYFTEFIGCKEYTKAKLDTQNMVSATKKYCATHGFDDQKTVDVKELVYKTCMEWLSENVLPTLEKISNLLDAHFTPPEEGKFLEIAQEEFLLSNEIAIEKSALRALTRYSGKNSKMSISFDSDQLNVTVFLKDDDESLIIKDPPKKLIQQIKIGL